MFYHIELIHETLIHPLYFGPDLMRVILRKTYREVEGTCPGHIGYIVAITSITQVVDGMIVDEGMALFTVKYNAIVFRPIKHEVVDGRVTHINKLGLFVDVGPMTCFISRNSLPNGMKYYCNEAPDCFRSDEGDAITIDDSVRLRFLGIRVDSDKIFGIGTLSDDFLGLIN